MKKKEKTEQKPKEKAVKKKERDEGYVLKKNGAMKALRIIFWTILVFIFIRGVAAILVPNKETVVDQMIQEFQSSLKEEKELNTEALAFAQNFAREYLTYTQRGEEDYRQRIKPYVSNNVYNQQNIVDFKNSAAAAYVQAYRVEKYSDTQLDVYVLAEVEYFTTSLSQNQSTYETATESEQTVLKVPLYRADGKYVVESLPLFVSDSIGVEGYAVKDYYGTSLKEAQTKEVKSSAENFLKAYYEQDTTVINYYLSASAEKSRFDGLDGRYAFGKITSISCYQEQGEAIVCLVEYTIKDRVNDTALVQKINLSVTKDGSRYYINAMNTRTGDIDF